MHPSTKASIRDFVIFQIKLAIDGFKDMALIPVSIAAFVADLVFKIQGPKRLFYRLMVISEKFDSWLNLNGIAEAAMAHDDGLFGVSTAGSDSYLGQMEQIVRGGDDPKGKRKKLR